MEASWFVVNQISAHVFDTLEKKKVPYIPVEITTPVEGTFLSFPKEYLQVVASALSVDSQAFDVVMTPTNREGVVFVVFLSQKASTSPQGKENTSRVVVQSARNAYVKACTARYKDEIARIQERAKQAEKQVEALQSQLIAALRELDETRARIQEIDTRGIDRITEAELGKEFDKIASFQNVAKVEVKEGWLIVDTRDIHHRDVGRLGTFTIRIRLTSETATETNGSVSWVSTVRIAPIKESQKHPHAGFSASPDGYCLGSAGHPVVEAIRQYEFAVALDIILRYLEEG